VDGADFAAGDLWKPKPENPALEQPHILFQETRKNGHFWLKTAPFVLKKWAKSGVFRYLFVTM
jgi:hypothetical protein